MTENTSVGVVVPMAPTTTVPPPLHGEQAATITPTPLYKAALRSRPDLSSKEKPWYHLNYHHLEPHRWLVPFSDKAFPGLPRIIPAIFRLFFLLFAIVTLGNSWAMAMLEGSLGKWWFSFGNLSYLFFILYLMLVNIYGLHHAVSPLIGKVPQGLTTCVLASEANLEQTTDGTAIMSVYAKESFCKKPRGYLLFLHVLYAMNFTFHVISVLMYWGFVVTRDEASRQSWVAVSIHGLQLVFFIIDAIFFNQTPIYASHFFVALFFGISYVFWAWIGQSIFRNDDGSPWSPYEFLSREDPQAPTKYLLMMITFTLTYFFSWAFHKIRDEAHLRASSCTRI